MAAQTPLNYGNHVNYDNYDISLRAMLRHLERILLKAGSSPTTGRICGGIAFNISVGFELAR